MSVSALGKLVREFQERLIPRLDVWHGSPHRHNQFSMEHIGTGEGAQAYGHGLYFAGNEDVARSYMQGMGPQQVNAVDSAYRAATRSFLGSGASPDDALRGLQQAYPDAPLDELERALRIETGAADGYLYQAQIPDAPYLDWDKPLSEQAPEVREAFSAINERAGIPGDIVPGYPDLPLADVSGQEAYRTVGSRVTGGREGRELSGALAESGIPGIRYLDGMSRGAGEGTSNYVLFDDRLIDIIRRNPNAFAGTALGASLLAQSEEAEAAPEALDLDPLYQFTARRAAKSLPGMGTSISDQIAAARQAREARDFPAVRNPALLQSAQAIREQPVANFFGGGVADYLESLSYGDQGLPLLESSFGAALDLLP